MSSLDTPCGNGFDLRYRCDCAGGETLAVGVIAAEDQAVTENWFEIGLSDVCKHIFIGGVSGSGKTHTCHYLLSQLWCEHRIPWLVLESSGKVEYRRLLASPLAGIYGCIRFSDETVSPLRFIRSKFPPVSECSPTWTVSLPFSALRLP